MDYEAPETYGQWTEEYTVQLRQVERYKEAREELIAALKDGIVANFIPTAKEQEHPRDGGSSSSRHTTRIALASGQPSMTLS